MQLFVYRTTQIFYKILFKTIFPLKAYWLDGFEMPAGPVILAGNHSSLLDGPTVVSAFPRVIHFLVEQSVQTWPVVRKFLPHLPIVIIDQKHPKKALITAAKALREGKSICIFPEGKLTEDGNMNPFQPGIFLIQSLYPEAPIIPFAIKDGYKRWAFQKWPRPGKFSIRFGHPIAYDDSLEHDEKPERLQSVISALLEH